MKKLFFTCLLVLYSLISLSQPLSSKKVDRLTERVLKEFNVPGIAVAVLKDGEVIHMKGYGVRSIATGEKTDEKTLFAIASNTKAFTTAALGILIGEERVTWDTRVIDIIPEFRLYNSYVTEDFRIRDLLTHRSGLGLGAGDLMMWPDSAMFTADDIIRNLRHLKQASPYRTRYDYDNLLYVVAGEVVERVSGMSWEEFVETRIMKPLDMTGSSASFKGLRERSNIIDAHVPVDGSLQVAPKQENRLHNSSGGIYSNISDLSKWVICQLNRGRYGPNLEKQIFSEKVHSEMWTPQTIKPLSENGPYNSHFSAYGLGWNLTDINGYLKVYHTGTHTGIVTRVTMLPELNLGIIVLTNHQVDEAHEAITYTLIDGYLGIRGVDRVEALKESLLRDREDAARITEEVWAKVEAEPSMTDNEVDNSHFTGRYGDPWFGDIIISEVNGKLRFNAVRSPRLRGDMFHYTGNTFIVRWDDRTFDADAFAIFSLDREGRPEIIRMEAISPFTDFSYDFHDLNLKKKQ
ncbi:MAG: serine hydrolase [Bacteroidales bacterium]|nr:serine hydrolase [Bacteroidales bacterium]MDT8372696.1 serine hydrolase [Bacteroidales bacterium]